ncbi:MAG: hypothetical protein KA774_09855 [Burkholderiaceae bacterium]|nr:hypothetical protein [Burkholderiaceae bacterium]
MAEPASSSAAGAAAGAAAWKAAGGMAGVAGGAAGLASIVVMLMMRPRSAAEWATALICTVVSSIAGGAAVVQYLELHAWADGYIGVVALGGLMFGCGLPGWALVRAVFTAIERRRSSDVVDLAEEVRRRWKGKR